MIRRVYCDRCGMVTDGMKSVRLINSFKIEEYNSLDLCNACYENIRLMIEVSQ